MLEVDHALPVTAGARSHCACIPGPRGKVVRDKAEGYPGQVRKVPVG